MNAQNYMPSQLAKKEQVLWVCSVFNSVLQFYFQTSWAAETFQIWNGQPEWKHTIYRMINFLMIKYKSIMKIKFSASGMY